MREDPISVVPVVRAFWKLEVVHVVGEAERRDGDDLFRTGVGEDEISRDEIPGEDLGEVGPEENVGVGASE